MIKKDKKQADKNFLFALILTVLLLLLAVCSACISSAASSELKGLKNSMNELYGDGPAEDVEGYGLILNGLGYGIGSLSLFVFRLLFVWLPALLGCYIFIFALISRLIYEKSARRILTYRILMGFSFSGQIMMLFFCLLLSTSGGWMSIIGLVSSIGIFGILFLGMRGTYTNRLTET